MNLEVIKAKAAELYDKAKKAALHVKDNMSEFSSRMFPRTLRIDRETNEKLGNLVAAREYARQAAPDYINRVMGKDSTDAERQMAGAVLTEMPAAHEACVYFRRRSASGR